MAKEAYLDPTDKTGAFVCVDLKAVEPLKTPVTLAAIKADKKFADMVLVKNSRLSVQAGDGGGMERDPEDGRIEMSRLPVRHQTCARQTRR